MLQGWGEVINVCVVLLFHRNNSDWLAKDYKAVWHFWLQILQRKIRYSTHSDTFARVSAWEGMCVQAHVLHVTLNSSSQFLPETAQRTTGWSICDCIAIIWTSTSLFSFIDCSPSICEAYFPPNVPGSKKAIKCDNQAGGGGEGGAFGSLLKVKVDVVAGGRILVGPEGRLWGVSSEVFRGESMQTATLGDALSSNEEILVFWSQGAVCLWDEESFQE